MLLTGKKKNRISIMTPKGIVFETELLDIDRSEKSVSCAVRKDGGDDPDVTTGALVYAEVSIGWGQKRIIIEGGQGVGRVTKPGLDQPVGNAAINHVPREMIRKEVLEICELADFKGSLQVEIRIPDGVRLAEKTFNKRLGIVGGISVLGTTGIVEPMSTQALLDTIRTELQVVKASGQTMVAMAPGNYGMDYMKAAYGYDLDQSVKCSNFIGASIDMAVNLGFEKMLLTGHIGKLVKVSGGMMNTHSGEGDCRMELMQSAGIKAGVPLPVLVQMGECVTTQEAVRLLNDCGCLAQTMDIILEKAMYYLRRRATDRMQIECIIYDNNLGELAESAGAFPLLQELR